MRKINAEIVADSISPQGHRITSFVLTYPRFIHSELMTHRLFSRNSASSRAIPLEKMVKMVEEDPFIPIAWQKDHKGMQGTEYLNEEEVERAELQWIQASKNAINSARMLNSNYFGVTKNLVTKQLCNRLLEPFMWHTVLVTATEWDNFFELRCPSYDGFSKNGEKVSFRSKKDVRKHFEELKLDTDLVDNQSFKSWQSINTSQAEIHIQALAEAMWDARNESTPTKLEPGDWHIPFGARINSGVYEAAGYTESDPDFADFSSNQLSKLGLSLVLKVATARCARLSYMTFDGEIDYEKDIKLHDQLLESRHMSPFEHCARVMDEKEYYSFVKGTIPTQIDEYGITNLEIMPFSSGYPIVGFTGLNPTNGDKYGWCNNFRGFIQYRHLVENEK